MNYKVYLISSFLLLSCSQTISHYFHKQKLPAYEKAPLEDTAAQDLGFVLFGTRRFGADFAFVQTLQYIMTNLKKHEKNYADIYEDRTRIDKSYKHFLRTVMLDPYFEYGYLFGAGILGFSRTDYDYDKAISILKIGSKNDPTNWQYRLYAAAIGYKSKDQTNQVIPLLEEAIKFPDCPTMIKNILANFYFDRKNFKRSAEIYLEIAENSRDDFYVDKAMNRLEKIKTELLAINGKS